MMFWRWSFLPAIALAILADRRGADPRGKPHSRGDRPHHPIAGESSHDDADGRGG